MSEDINIQSVEFTGRTSGPHLLIVGGVHGDEFEPMAAIRRLIELFQSKGSPGLSGRLTLVPVVNEPAFENSHRTALDGKDLARTCPGKENGSITEQIAFEFSKMIRSADYFIDLHTGGTTISVLPMAGYMLHSDLEILEKQRAMARSFNLPVVWGTSAEHEGRSLSVARDAGVPAIYTEYLGSATCNSDGVTAYFEGCLNVMALIRMINTPPLESRVQHFVEDDKERSGHMQLSHPSPITGFFEPAIQLAEEIQAGDLIGTVCNVLGNEKIQVYSEQAGIVLTLKTFSFVKEGEGLSVIMDHGIPSSSD